MGRERILKASIFNGWIFWVHEIKSLQCSLPKSLVDCSLQDISLPFISIVIVFLLLPYRICIFSFLSISIIISSMKSFVIIVLFLVKINKRVGANVSKVRLDAAITKYAKETIKMITLPHGVSTSFHRHWCLLLYMEVALPQKDWIPYVGNSGFLP